MDFKEIKSSNLQSAAYDGKDKMQIKFANGVYEYEGIKPALFAEFEKTFQADASSGQFFAKNLRHLKYKKL